MPEAPRLPDRQRTFSARERFPERWQEAVAELDAVRDDAQEEGLPIPTRNLVARVKKLLKRVFDFAPFWYSVYPTEDGEIAIETGGEPHGAVAILCKPYDVWCVVSVGKGEHLSRRRAWFQKMEELPDPFVRKALTDLGRP